MMHGSGIFRFCLRLLGVGLCCAVVASSSLADDGAHDKRKALLRELTFKEPKDAPRMHALTPVTPETRVAGSRKLPDDVVQSTQVQIRAPSSRLGNAQAIALCCRQPQLKHLEYRLNRQPVVALSTHCRAPSAVGAQAVDCSIRVRPDRAQHLRKVALGTALDARKLTKVAVSVVPQTRVPAGPAVKVSSIEPTTEAKRLTPAKHFELVDLRTSQPRMPPARIEDPAPRTSLPASVSAAGLDPGALMPGVAVPNKPPAIAFRLPQPQIKISRSLPFGLAAVALHTAPTRLTAPSKTLDQLIPAAKEARDGPLRFAIPQPVLRFPKPVRPERLTELAVTTTFDWLKSVPEIYPDVHYPFLVAIVAMQPDSDDAGHAIALMLQGQGRKMTAYDRARNLAAWSKQYRDGALRQDLLYGLAAYQYRHGNYKSALELLKSYEQEFGDRKCELLWLRGLIATRTDDSAGAKERFLKLIQDYPTSANVDRAKFLIAWVNLTEGKLDEAKPYLKEVAETCADKELAEKAAALLRRIDR